MKMIIIHGKKKQNKEKILTEGIKHRAISQIVSINQNNILKKEVFRDTL
jgi:hypothetical protein